MRAFILLLLLMVPKIGLAQMAATLVADQVTIERDVRLVASGNIEVLYDGTRLSASQVVYDQTTDRLQIIGPIFIQDQNGAVITAEQATLDPKLESGILRGARLVLDRRLQLAANRIDRQGGRFNQLYKTAVTSCQVCGDQNPLWDIRAERVVHDEAERQLYFTNAIFRVKGIPIFWLPRARLPDPTLDRATGFLIPTIRSSDTLGTGLKAPYFIALDDHRDLTLTPYLSANTSTLEARYRQAFISGDLLVNMAVSDDTLINNNRAYLFAEGRFDLARDYRLSFDVEAVSDPAYLSDYSYADTDRLDSAISLTRVRSDELIFGSFTYFESLRDDEVDAELPPIVADFSYERRVTGIAGGALTYATNGDLLYRTGNATGDAGRDMLRIGGQFDWQREFTLNNGVLFDSRFGASADVYRIWDDPAYGSVLTRAAPYAQINLRFPLKKISATSRQLLEPVVSLAWSEHLGDRPPNEDSTRPEFDPGNLLDQSRFPGDDRIEHGLRLATGISWTRHGNRGNQTRLTFGRVFRDQNNDAFTVTSGLRNLQSDWLIAGQHSTTNGLRVEGRALLDQDLNFNSGAAKVDWSNKDISLAASYIWEAPDPAIGRNDAAGAWTIDSRIQLEDAWAVEFDTRYDVDAQTPTRARVGLEWQNECVTVNLSVSRRYTSSSTLEPSTDYGLSVALTGFSAGRSGAAARTRCNNS